MKPARTLISILVALGGAGALVVGCGGSGSSTQDPRAALRAVKPIEAATVDAVLTLALDHAPAGVGSPVELRLGGPLRSNGAGKLPSLDWAIAFDGFGTAFKSRVVSTGSNVFVRLGGEDFQVGEQVIGEVNQSAAQAGGAGKGSGLSALGVDPLEAIGTVRAAGSATIGGTKTTHYSGTIDKSRMLDQVQRLLTNVGQSPVSIPGAALPQFEVTPEVRQRVNQIFRNPRFAVDVAPDHTVRRLAFSTRFATPAANRAAAGGVTGGTISYKVQYTHVGEAPAIQPLTGARPLSEFLTALQQIAAKKRP